MTDNNLTGQQVRTAIKHITIPEAKEYESILQDYGYDKEAAQTHFEKIVEGITSGINTLIELSKKDSRYIVEYYDYEIQEPSDSFRFDIFIRMENLTPLNLYIQQQGITIGEIIKMGMNLCDALFLCHGSGIIHYNIKEKNIFIDENGNYKLGDFDVVKAAAENIRTGSMKGTASYTAPEIHFQQPYDSSIDIYSLGIVLYKLLNDRRLPFMPNALVPLTADDKNAAETKRLNGDQMPLPANAKKKLADIILKACSPKSKRYTNAKDLKYDLQEFLNTIAGTEYEQTVVIPAADEDEKENPDPEKPKDLEKQKKRLVTAAVIGAIVLTAVIAGYVFSVLF